MPPRTNFRVTEFTGRSQFDTAAELCCHRLHAVTDPQHRHTEIEDLVRHPRGIALVNGRGPARQDDSARRVLGDKRIIHVMRVLLTVHAQLAYTTRDQLSVLGSEIENEYLVSVHLTLSVASMSGGNSRLV